MKEYDLIKDHYKHFTTARSKVPLMQHIDEGLTMLKSWDPPEVVLRAWCLHPLVQNNKPFDRMAVSSAALYLAERYSEKANSFLCCPENDHFLRTMDPRNLRQHLGEMGPWVSMMLLADKLQNQEDFLLYHYGTHKRSEQLNRYFILWIQTLMRYYLKVDLNSRKDSK